MSLHFTSFVNFVRSASMLRTVLNPEIGAKNHDDKLPFDSLSSPRYPPTVAYLCKNTGNHAISGVLVEISGIEPLTS